MPSERVTLLEAGVCREVVHDTQTAARAGRASTGHGLPAPNPWGPFPLHMGMAPGTTPPARSSSAASDAGLLVTRFHYTNVVHPKQVVVTGMTRDGLFLVEDGRIAAPGAQPALHAGATSTALAAVEAVGGERRPWRASWARRSCPPCALGSFSFTGDDARHVRAARRGRTTAASAP